MADLPDNGIPRHAPPTCEFRDLGQPILMPPSISLLKVNIAHLFTAICRRIHQLLPLDKLEESINDALH